MKNEQKSQSGASAQKNGEKNGEKKGKSSKKSQGSARRSPKKEGIERYEEGVRDFFVDHKREITVAGIVAVTGFAVYAIAKWAPLNDIISRIKEKYEEEFGEDDYFEEEEEADEFKPSYASSM